MGDFIAMFDIGALRALAAIRDPQAVYYFIWVSELGRAYTIYALATCIALVLITRKAYARAAGLAIAVSSAGILILLTKGLIARPRPPFELLAYREEWWSFPSAHAALSMALFGYLANLAMKARSRAVRIISIAAAVVLIAAVSFSRIYLGVHYPSDVLAGLLLGAACAWLGAILSRALKLP